MGGMPNLLGDFGMGPVSQPAVRPNNNNNNNGGGGGDFILDLLDDRPSQPQQPSTDEVGNMLGINTNSGGSSNTSSPQTSSPSSGKAQPFEAYKNHGITATFNFQPNQGHGVCRVLAVFHNSNSYDIDNFSLMIAVPKYIKLQFKPASGTQLMALSQNSITQKFQLTNTMFGTKPFIIRVQVLFTQNGQQMKDRTQVQFPDYCC